MNPKHLEGHGTEAPSTTPSQAAYVPPRLQSLGSVAELTLIGVGATSEAFAQGSLG